MKKPLEVFFDARFLTANASGIGTHIRGLLQGFSRISIPDYMRIAVFGPEFIRPYIPPTSTFRYVPCDIPVLSAKEQIMLPIFLLRNGAKILHVPHFNIPFFWHGMFLITIHDLTPMHFPKQFSFFSRTTFRILTRAGCARSTAVIADSQATKQDLIQHRYRETGIYVVYNGVDAPPEVDSEIIQYMKQRFGLQDRFLLFCSNLKPHKNVAMLVRLIRELQKEYPGLQLVLAGSRDPRYRELNTELERTPAGLVILTGYISQIELSALYRGSAVFLFPSLAEGFGLPPLEAMACGTPVVASSCSSIPEILGEAAIMVDPGDLEEWSKAIRLVLSSSAEDLEKIRQKGIARAAEFSWQNAAKQVVKIYKDTVWRK
jgi:glycosyltransferase involved in cell wall biosynthesis